MDLSGFAGGRKHAKCPQCTALERHRLQYLVVRNVLKSMNVSEMKMLHFAPEAFFRRIFSRRFGKYETADLSMKGVDHKVDLQSLPFKAATYDFIFASHVLEHILDDKRAIEEIRRVLKPHGVAILPVPVVALLILTRRRDVMGSYANGRVITAAATAAAAIVLVLNLLLVLQIVGVPLPALA